MSVAIIQSNLLATSHVIDEVEQALGSADFTDLSFGTCRKYTTALKNGFRKVQQLRLNSLQEQELNDVNTIAIDTNAYMKSNPSPSHRS
jgi:hypothetical protein